MAFSTEAFNGDGATTDFAVNMPYIDKSHITLVVSGTPVTFAWLSNTLIRADVAPASGTGNVIVTRTTPITLPLVDFEDASTVTEANLDLAVLQALYVIQENNDAAGSYMTEDTGDAKWNGESKPIKNVTAPTNANDVATKTYVDGLFVAAGNVPTPANPGDDGKLLQASGGAFSWQAPASGDELTSTDAGASGAPAFKLFRDSVSPAANDLMGYVNFDGRDDGGNRTTFARLMARLLDPTDTSEDGALLFQTIVAGTLATRFDLAQGMYATSLTDKGAGTFNGVAVYDNGDRVRAVGLDTLWVPAGAMVSRTTNGAASGLTETTTNKIMLRTFDFDPATEEYTQFSLVFPKSWDLGTVTAEFVWKAESSTGNVIWGCQGVAISDDGVLDTAFGTAQEVTDTLTATTDIMKSAATAAITIGNTPADDDLVFFQVYRKAADAGDTLSADARLIGVKLKYTRDAKNDA